MTQTEAQDTTDHYSGTVKQLPQKLGTAIQFYSIQFYSIQFNSIQFNSNAILLLEINTYLIWWTFLTKLKTKQVSIPLWRDLNMTGLNMPAMTLQTLNFLSLQKKMQLTRPL